ncbi:hypothetical protein [Amycolatopsis sp. YIM 10]|uniref:hypothetical protein n=1 Tax=Amycolatopsis sp. YIM 10 TaxID=2653857 RepID=UPI00129020A1|nr:hypothetical protein [Amycolatopsis sp. YIM 10]QFU89159.1 hypothetical protein YIM_19900 [Amycolatopsis sp. YIM 10]
MRKTIAALVAGGVAIGVLAGCGSTDTTTNTASSAQPLLAQLSRDYEADFDPLVSPKQALELGDLIVRGTVAEVHDGITTAYPDAQRTQRGQGQYVTLQVAVTEVVSGPAAAVTGGQVYVQVAKSPSTPTSAIAGANTKADAVLILEDISTWKPSPDATVNRPEKVPAAAPLFFAYPDGLWLQGSADAAMAGSATEREHLAPAWGAPTTLNDLVGALRSAR